MTSLRGAASLRAALPHPFRAHLPIPTLDIYTLLLSAPILLFSMVAHEYAHGWAALHQGDPTAWQLGRLSFNPVKHIDPFMTILLPALLVFLHAGFLLGGAKPVPVNARNFRNYRRGDIIVSLAGVAANALIAIVCTAFIPVLGILGREAPATARTMSLLQTTMQLGVWINLALIAFNLLPIPPLDGSHLVKYVLPPRWSWRYQQLGRMGIVLLLLFLYFGGPLLALWMSPANAVTSAMVGSVHHFLLPNPWAP